MPAFRDAFNEGKRRAGARPTPLEGTGEPVSPFQAGVEWVRRVLLPAIDLGNTELEPDHVAFQIDLNLDHRSTNHPHADFWLTELGEGQRAVGPKYSINVLAGENVWLYKPGAPGRELGPLERCGPDEIQNLLEDAVREFGSMAK